MYMANLKGEIKLAIDRTEFESIIDDIVKNEDVKKMKNYRQHYNTSCYEHCYDVAFVSYKICKKLKLDYKAVSRAGMLHDLFLYDWRYRQDDRKGFHAFTHPRTALENAQKHFTLSEKEQDIILKHMWPLTLKFPRYPESFIVTLTDKYCTLKESFIHYFSKKQK